MLDPFSLPRLYPASAAPIPRSDWALFLDLDGTLLDIAPTPDRVIVPPDLVYDLAAASVSLGGALAIVSGRPLPEIDALLAPLRLPGAGEHGAVVRLPSGLHDEVDVRVPQAWVDALAAAVVANPDALLERKMHSVAVHYRQAPRLEDYFRRLCNQLVMAEEDKYETLHGKMAIEIRSRTVTKARAVSQLMSTEPFIGRRPIFVGDDVTDEDGFRAAAHLGGEGIDVFVRFGGLPREVRRWLKCIALL